MCVLVVCVCGCACAWMCLVDFAKHFCTLHPRWQLQLLHKYIFCICHAHFTMRQLRAPVALSFFSFFPLLPSLHSSFSLALVKWKCKSSPAVVATLSLFFSLMLHVQYKNTLASFYAAPIENLSARCEFSRILFAKMRLAAALAMPRLPRPIQARLSIIQRFPFPFPT